MGQEAAAILVESERDAISGGDTSTVPFAAWQQKKPFGTVWSWWGSHASPAGSSVAVAASLTMPWLIPTCRSWAVACASQGRRP